MIVYMMHPKHGRMPCSSLSEVEQAKVHGWSEVAPDAPVAEPAAPEPAADAPVARRRGRPPKDAK